MKTWEPVCANQKCRFHKQGCSPGVKWVNYMDIAPVEISAWQQLSPVTVVKHMKRHEVYKPGPGLGFPMEIVHICDTCSHVLTMMDGGPV
jgi:hypothetical protein